MGLPPMFAMPRLCVLHAALYNFNVLKEIKVYLNVTVFTGPPKPPKPAKKAE